MRWRFPLPWDPSVVGEGCFGVLKLPEDEGADLILEAALVAVGGDVRGFPGLGVLEDNLALVADAETAVVGALSSKL